MTRPLPASLHCKGLAGRLNKRRLSFEDAGSHRLEGARALGIHWCLCTGGEPTCLGDLFRQRLRSTRIPSSICSQHGTLIDQAFCDRVQGKWATWPSTSRSGASRYLAQATLAAGACCRVHRECSEAGRPQCRGMSSAAAPELQASPATVLAECMLVPAVDRQLVTSTVASIGDMACCVSPCC